MMHDHEGECEYGMVAAKRGWCPEWLWWLMRPIVVHQPFRWMLTTPTA